MSQDNDRSIDFIKPNPEQEQPTESDSFEQSITVEIMKNKSEREMCNEKVETALKEEEPSGDKQETAETMVTEKMEIVTENKTELIEEEVNEEHNEDNSLPDTVSSSLENLNTPNKVSLNYFLKLLSVLYKARKKSFSLNFLRSLCDLFWPI